MIWYGTAIRLLPESDFGVFLQTTSPFKPNFGFAFFQTSVLLTSISELSKSRS